MTLAWPRRPKSNPSSLWLVAANQRRGLSIVTKLFLLSATCLMMVSGCSTKAPLPRVSPPPNLVQPCPPLPNRPEPTVDPERLVWELAIIYAYAQCQSRHAGLVDAVK